MHKALGSTSVQNFFYGCPAKNGRKLKIFKNKILTPWVLAKLWKNTKKKEIRFAIKTVRNVSKVFSN